MSAQRKPWSFLLVLLLTLVALSIYGEMGLDDYEDPATPPMPDLPTLVEQDASASSLTAADSERDALPSATLQVEVIDARGSPLPDALIRATSPSGKGGQLEASGRASWDGLEEGNWEVRVELDGCGSVDRTVPLVRGQVELVQIQLYVASGIHGRVVNSFGRPLPNATVWFLKEGHIHPPTRENAEKKKKIFVKTALDGSFEAPELAAGEYWFSVGPPGRAEMPPKGPFRLSPGDSRAVDIVIERGSQVSVQFQPHEEGQEFHMGRMALARKRELPQLSDRSQRRKVDLWRTTGRTRLEDDYTAFLDEVAPGEYKIELITAARYRSEESFMVEEAKAYSIKVTVPHPYSREEARAFREQRRALGESAMFFQPLYDFEVGPDPKADAESRAEGVYWY